MSDRVSVVVNTSPSSPPTAGPVSGRYFIVGQTQKGSTTPTSIRSMREFIAEYGARTVGQAMYDAAEMALRRARRHPRRGPRPGQGHDYPGHR